MLDMRVNATVTFHGLAYDVSALVESTVMDSTLHVCYIYGIIRKN